MQCRVITTHPPPPEPIPASHVPHQQTLPLTVPDLPPGRLNITWLHDDARRAAARIGSISHQLLTLLTNPQPFFSGSITRSSPSNSFSVVCRPGFGALEIRDLVIRDREIMDMDLQQPGPVDGQTNENIEEVIANRPQDGSIATPSQTVFQPGLHPLDNSADGGANTNPPSISSSQALPSAAPSSLPPTQSQSTNPPLSQDVASNSKLNSTPTFAPSPQPQTQIQAQSQAQSHPDPNNINANVNANANTPRQPPHPDSPLPPALQAQFYARFRIQPPQTHGQLQQFLRQAAQAQAAFQARSANMNMNMNANTNGAAPGVRPGESSGGDAGPGPGPGLGAGPTATAMNTNAQAGGQALPNLKTNLNPSSGPGTPNSLNGPHAEQSSNSGVSLIPEPASAPVVPAAEPISAQKSGSQSGTPLPNTPAQAVENGTSTPHSGTMSFQPGPISLGVTDQAVGQGQTPIPQLNEQTLGGTPGKPRGRLVKTFPLPNLY